MSLLHKMDRAVPVAVGKIIHLPSDTPVPMFYELPGEGSFAVIELEFVNEVPSILEGIRERLRA